MTTEDIELYYTGVVGVGTGLSPLAESDLGSGGANELGVCRLASSDVVPVGRAETTGKALLILIKSSMHL